METNNKGLYSQNQQADQNQQEQQANTDTAQQNTGTQNTAAPAGKNKDEEEDPIYSYGF